MNIKELHLRNFRNYTEHSVFLDDGVNLFVGSNAQGKTNLLEAMYLLSTGKSHRTSVDSELLKWGEPFFIIKGKIDRCPRELEIELSYTQKDRKQAKVNKNTPVKPSKLTTFLNVVMFTPDDLELIKGSPINRRKFLDQEISQANPLYRSLLIEYSKVLNQRNTLLKDQDKRSFSEEIFEAFTEQIVEVGAKIIAKRAEYILSLGVIARIIHKKITGSKENLTLKYIPSFAVESFSDHELIKKTYMSRLTSYRNIEFAKRYTLYGPHRDDMVFEVDSIDMQTYGSQGQQRSCVLSLKIAEVEYLKSVIKDAPVLLLDDVLSELDESRREYLIKEAVEKHQTMITSADPDCLRYLPKSSKVFYIKKGEIGGTL